MNRKLKKEKGGDGVLKWTEKKGKMKKKKNNACEKIRRKGGTTVKQERTKRKKGNGETGRS